MLTVTKAAARQIQEAARQNKMEGMALRMAVRVDGEGSFHYLMGFDDVQSGKDISIESEGVQIVFAEDELPRLKGMTLDFVQLDNGETNFIFVNPNDPAYVPPSG